MLQRDKLWMGLIAYLVASISVLFVFEIYIRGYVVETFLIFNHGGLADLQHLHAVKNGRGEDEMRRIQKSVAGGSRGFSKLESTKTRTTMAKNAKREEGNDDDTSHIIHKRKTRTLHRTHTCTLPGNQTITLPASPDLIIAGAQKGGTSAFYFLLRQHPNFYSSRKFESHFFDWQFAVPPKDLNNPTFWEKFNASTEEELLCAARKQYIEENFQVEKLFSGKRNKRLISFEKTPNYMFLPQVPELISKVCTWRPKIILILRNPVDRAYSHIMMDLGKGRINETFEDMIQEELKIMRKVGLTNVPLKPPSEWHSLGPSEDHLFYNPPKNMTQEEADHANWMVYRLRHMRNYLQRGIYSAQIERWMKFFPLNESLMVINSETLTKEPRKVMGEVMNFMGAPKPQYFESEEVDIHLKEKDTVYAGAAIAGILNRGSYAPMRNETRRFLEKFYKPYNAELANILGEEWRGIWGTQNEIDKMATT